MTLVDWYMLECEPPINRLAYLNLFIYDSHYHDTALGGSLGRGGYYRHQSLPYGGDSLYLYQYFRPRRREPATVFPSVPSAL